MGTPKPRILPWLVSMLDEGQLEGVAWLDERRTRFRIPWKHGLRQDAQAKDFGIFQAWAEASGAYIPGRDKPDLPTWKRNFRSALNRKEVLHLADDHSKDPHDPHKVYQFVDPEARDSSQLDTSPETEEGSTSDAQEDFLELLSDMALVPPPSDRAQGQYSQLLSPNLDNPILCPDPAPSQNPLKLLLVPEEQWEFEVTAFYRGHQVLQQTTFCPGGLRLVSSEAGNTTLPGQPIMLPDPEVLLTDKVVTEYVQRVLKNLGGGLALWQAGQRLYVRRWGHCHAYWAIGEELLPDCEPGQKGEVPKDMDSDVFDLRPFVTGGSHLPQGPVKHGAVRRGLLTREHSGLTHFQQPAPLPHLRAVQGLPAGPGRGHGFLSCWGGLSPDLLLASIKQCLLHLVVCLVLGIPSLARSQLAAILMGSWFKSLQLTQLSNPGGPALFRFPPARDLLR